MNGRFRETATSMEYFGIESGDPAIRERNRTIVKLAKEHVRPADIAARLKISPRLASVVLCLARRCDPTVPLFPSGSPGRAPEAYSGPVVVRIPRDLYRLLAPHAARRNLRVSQFLEFLLSTIIEEDLVNAVLDDAVEASHPPIKPRDTTPCKGSGEAPPAIPAVHRGLQTGDSLPAVNRVGTG